jgi:hypothetical protein
MRIPVNMFTLSMVMLIPFTSLQLFVFRPIATRGSQEGLLQLPILDPDGWTICTLTVPSYQRSAAVDRLLVLHFVARQR